MIKKRILCIEDHPEMIELVKLILGRRGYEVEGAVGGQEGLDAMVQDPPDLILLDLMMPDVDGWEVYRQVKAKADLKDIPVIIITAKAQDIDRVLATHIAGVNGYITKPFGPRELEDSVRRVLGEMNQSAPGDKGHGAEGSGVQSDEG